MALRYIRHWEFPSTNPNESIIVSESQEPNTVVLRAKVGGTEIAVKLTEAQFRALTSLAGYGTDCVKFQAETTGASPQETQQGEAPLREHRQ